MKQPTQPAVWQPKLPLVDFPALATPRQQELSQALMNQLVQAARQINICGVLPVRRVRVDAKLTFKRLQRKALVYFRQSSTVRVIHNLERQRRQYDLTARAQELGFREFELNLIRQ